MSHSFLNKFYSIFLIGLTGVLCSFNISSKPAKPGLIEVVQPDGSKVKLELIGQRGNNYALTEDGFPVIADSDGFYCYAESEGDNRVVPSNLRVTNIAERDAITKSFLTSIDKKKIISMLNRFSDPLPVTRSTGLMFDSYPRFGKQKGIVILVEYQDCSFTIPEPTDYFSRMLNEEGFSDDGSTGSARDYYLENSFGLFDPSFDVYGPVKLSKDYGYYGSGDDLNAYRMVTEACAALENEIDFSQYDRDNDGIIDIIYIIYAGYGEADGGGSATVWPHAWMLSEADPYNKYYVDGLLLEKYACSNELQHSSDEPDGVSSFLHEFSHILGLPDLYSVYGSGGFTPGYWSIMDVGTYLNNSRTPPNFSSYEKYSLGWLTPEELSAGEYDIDNYGDSGIAYIVRTDSDDEYFLLENRQKKGWDAFLPGTGMLIWHIDYKPSLWELNEVNTDSKHLNVDLIEADDKRTYDSYSGDPFPGSSMITEFTCTTNPSFTAWDKSPVSFDLYDITETNDGHIRFRAENCKNSSIETLIDPDLELITIIGETIIPLVPGLSLYDLTGRKLTDISDKPIEVNPGLYIIRSPEKNLKIFVR